MFFANFNDEFKAFNSNDSEAWIAYIPHTYLPVQLDKLNFLEDRVLSNFCKALSFRSSLQRQIIF